MVRQEGQRQGKRRVQIYNLDVIISVGYRVNSRRAVRFRQWATRVLREHLTRGWTLHQQRFEASARKLEAAMALVPKAAQRLPDRLNASTRMIRLHADGQPLALITPPLTDTPGPAA
ncbi:RhuM family protein [uncultured Kushneria sp.]|uniref:RhuM family protein n=1 Tax=uncultured Kushneria sp. TaxID=905033 RepID=UPI003458151F